MTVGYIYIIKSKKTDNVYIGSTKHNILKRFKMHENNYAHDINSCTSREIIKYGDAFVELLEKFEYNDIKELREREKDFIQSKKFPCVNISWNTKEDDDIIFLKKHFKDEKQKEMAKKIINTFEENVLYKTNEMREKMKTIFDDLDYDHKDNKKLLGFMCSILKIAGKKFLCCKDTSKRQGRKVITIYRYMLTDGISNERR